MRYRFMAVFVNKREATFESIRTIINDIFIAAQLYGMYGQIMRETDEEEARKQCREETEKNRRTIWYMGKDDIIEPRIKKATEELEAICRPVILKS